MQLEGSWRKNTETQKHPVGKYRKIIFTRENHTAERGNELGISGSFVNDVITEPSNRTY